MEFSYFAIIIGAIFVNNVVLAQFLGICPFLGVSSKVETSLGMGAAVTFVMAIAAVVAWLIQTYVLVPLDIVYMQTIVFILVIAALVQMVEIMLKKLSPSLYQALGIFLPLIGLLFGRHILGTCCYKFVCLVRLSRFDRFLCRDLYLLGRLFGYHRIFDVLCLLHGFFCPLCCLGRFMQIVCRSCFLHIGRYQFCHLL